MAAVYPAVAPTPDRRRSTHLGPDRGGQRRIGSHRGLRVMASQASVRDVPRPSSSSSNSRCSKSATCSSRISVNVSLTTSGAVCPGSFAQGTSRIYRRPRKPQPNHGNLSSQVTGNSGGIPDECPCRQVTACRASPRTFIFSGRQATCKHTQRVMRRGCFAGPDHSAGPNDLRATTPTRRRCACPHSEARLTVLWLEQFGACDDLRHR